MIFSASSLDTASLIGFGAASSVEGLDWKAVKAHVALAMSEDPPVAQGLAAGALFRFVLVGAITYSSNRHLVRAASDQTTDNGHSRHG